MKSTGEFLVLTDVPRHSVANALQVQARNDVGEAMGCVNRAFSNAAARVSAATNRCKTQELRDVLASARLEINAACDAFAASMNAAEHLFQTGVDLQADEPEPPKEEVPANA